MVNQSEFVDTAEHAGAANATQGNHPSAAPHPKWFWACVVGVCLVAATIRFGIIHHGLPFVYHEDEPIYLNRAMAFSSGNFDPDYFKKPTFFLYLYYALYWVGFHFSGFTHWQAFEAHFRQDPTFVVTLGRSLTALFSTVTVAVLIPLCIRVFQPILGLGSARWFSIIIATWLMLDPTHLRTSGNLLADIPALCMIVLTAVSAFQVYEKGRLKDYLLCGALTALVMSFKYNFFSVAFLVSAHLLRPDSTHSIIHWRHWWHQLKQPRLWIGLTTALLTFLALNPYVLLNHERFLEHFLHEKDHMTQRSLNTGRSFQPMVAFDNLFFQIFPKALGWPVYIVSLLGGFITLWQVIQGICQQNNPEKNLSQSHWPSDLWPRLVILFSFPLTFLLVLCQFRLVNAKYVLPLLPFWYILCGLGLFWLVQYIRQKQALKITQHPQVAAILLCLAVVGISWPPVSSALNFIQQMALPNTRTEARLALDKLIAAHTTDSPSPSVWAEPESIPITGWDFPKEQGMLATPKPALQAPKTEVTPFRQYAPQQSAPVTQHILNQEKPAFVVVMLKPVKGPDNQPLMPFEQSYYDTLAQHYTVQAVFSPYPHPSSVEASMIGHPVTHWIQRYAELKPQKQKALQAGPILVILKRTF